MDLLNTHAVIICFDYCQQELDPLFELDRKLDRILKLTRAGIYDGHEIAMDNSDGSVYMYGPNAEILYKTIKPILDDIDFLRGATAYLRFGPPHDDVKEIEFEI